MMTYKVPYMFDSKVIVQQCNLTVILQCNLHHLNLNFSKPTKIIWCHIYQCLELWNMHTNTKLKYGNHGKYGNHSNNIYIKAFIINSLYKMQHILLPVSISRKWIYNFSRIVETKENHIKCRHIWTVQICISPLKECYNL